MKTAKKLRAKSPKKVEALSELDTKKIVEDAKARWRERNSAVFSTAKIVEVPSRFKSDESGMAPAFLKAYELFGPGATVALNPHNPEEPFQVGKKESGFWTKRGDGKSWDEAFGKIIDFPDGHPPKWVLPTSEKTELTT